MATTVHIKRTAVRIIANGVSDRVIPNPSYMFDVATNTHRFFGGGLEARALHTDVSAAYGDEVPLTWLNAAALAYKFETYLTA